MPTKIARAVWSTNRPFFFLATLSALLAFFSCTTAPEDSGSLQVVQEPHIRQGVNFHPPGPPREWDWETIAEGILYTNFVSDQIPLRWHLVSVDLHNPAVQPIAYPAPEAATGSEVFAGRTTWQFLRETDALVAVNASPFTAPLTYLLPHRSVVGLFINQGKIISPAIPRYSALCLERNGPSWVPSIISDQTQYPPQTELALGGFFTILEEGLVQSFPACSLDSRTAIGTTQDNRYLLILYVEGKSKRKSSGLSFEESALVLQAAGAWDALQMDGGGSAALSVRGKDITGRFHRRAANILGFTLTFH